MGVRLHAIISRTIQGQARQFVLSQTRGMASSRHPKRELYDRFADTHLMDFRVSGEKGGDRLPGGQCCGGLFSRKRETRERQKKVHKINLSPAFEVSCETSTNQRRCPLGRALVTHSTSRPGHGLGSWDDKAPALVSRSCSPHTPYSGTPNDPATA